jgi:hypothetical protein
MPGACQAVLGLQTNNPTLKESLTDIANRWAALATELEATRALMAELAAVPPGETR